MFGRVRSWRNLARHFWLGWHWKSVEKSHLAPYMRHLTNVGVDFGFFELLHIHWANIWANFGLKRWVGDPGGRFGPHEHIFLIYNFVTYLFIYIRYPYSRSRLLVGRSPPNLLCLIRTSPGLKVTYLSQIQKPQVPEKKFESENSPTKLFLANIS